jgi:xylulokinase
MQAGEGYLLAIDAGTTNTRCILFDLEGMPVAEAYREPRVHHPQINRTEVEPEDWWDATVAVIRETLQRAEVPSEKILGVGLCGLQHALVPIDSEGRSLSRSMLWMDQRCQPQVEQLVREHSDLIEAIIGKERAFSTMLSAPKLRWIVENEPDLVRHTHKFLLVKDFIRFRLSGTVATDPHDAAGTGLFDRRTGEWSHSMLELIGVPRDKMPPIHDSTQVVGGVTEEAAQATGLALGTPVVVGSGDVLCTCTGANAFDPKRACLYLGTAAWISIPGTRGSTIGATATTGASLRWLMEPLGIGGFQRSDSYPPHGSSYTALLQEAESVPPGSRGLIFLPHLMGERGPRHDPEAKGVFFGLTLAHGRGDITRAVLEGCAFQLRRILENSGAYGWEMVAVGGGAKSALWLDILADVTGIALLVPRVLEAGALGAAIFAGVGVGVYPGVQEAAEALVQIVGQHEPNRARQDLYGRIYSIFLDLEERVAPLYGRLPL